MESTGVLSPSGWSAGPPMRLRATFSPHALCPGLGCKPNEIPGRSLCSDLDFMTFWIIPSSFPPLSLISDIFKSPLLTKILFTIYPSPFTAQHNRLQGHPSQAPRSPLPVPASGTQHVSLLTAQLRQFPCKAGFHVTYVYIVFPLNLM